MNEWLIAATALLFGFLPCLWLCWRSDVPNALVGLEMAGTLTPLVLILLAEGFGRAPFYDLALVLTPLSIAGNLVFVHFLERWL